MSLITKIRSRRAIQGKLDEVSKIFNSSLLEEEDKTQGTGTECAIVTEDGDILTGKARSPKPFAEIAQKVRRLRESADKVSQCLLQNRPTVMHLRGTSNLVSAYDLGQNTLVALSTVNAGVRSPDLVIARIDSILGVNGDASKLIAQLTRLLDDI